MPRIVSILDVHKSQALSAIDKAKWLPSKIARTLKNENVRLSAPQDFLQNISSISVTLCTYFTGYTDDAAMCASDSCRELLARHGSTAQECMDVLNFASLALPIQKLISTIQCPSSMTEEREISSLIWEKLFAHSIYIRQSYGEMFARQELNDIRAYLRSEPSRRSVEFLTSMILRNDMGNNDKFLVFIRHGDAPFVKSVCGRISLMGLTGIQSVTKFTQSLMDSAREVKESFRLRGLFAVLRGRILRERYDPLVDSGRRQDPTVEAAVSRVSTIMSIFEHVGVMADPERNKLSPLPHFIVEEVLREVLLTGRKGHVLDDYVALTDVMARKNPAFEQGLTRLEMVSTAIEVAMRDVPGMCVTPAMFAEVRGDLSLYANPHPENIAVPLNKFIAKLNAIYNPGISIHRLSVSPGHYIYVPDASVSEKIPTKNSSLPSFDVFEKDTDMDMKNESQNTDEAMTPHFINRM